MKERNPAAAAGPGGSAPPHPLLGALTDWARRSVRRLLKRSAALPAASPLAPREFRTLVRHLVPRRYEPWQALGWETSLRVARDRARREGRPLFLWVMDGHPLGAT